MSSTVTILTKQAPKPEADYKAACMHQIGDILHVCEMHEVARVGEDRFSLIHVTGMNHERAKFLNEGLTETITRNVYRGPVLVSSGPTETTVRKCVWQIIIEDLPLLAQVELSSKAKQATVTVEEFTAALFKKTPADWIDPTKDVRTKELEAVDLKAVLR